MWGFYNQRDRNLGKGIFKKIIDPNISKKFINGKVTEKGPDQHFLTTYVYPLIRSRSVIHDSFLCNNYKDSKPFPTKRIGSCFIGAAGNYEKCSQEKFHECPINCRPEAHKDWVTC